MTDCYKSLHEGSIQGRSGCGRGHCQCHDLRVRRNGLGESMYEVGETYEVW